MERDGQIKVQLCQKTMSKKEVIIIFDDILILWDLCGKCYQLCYLLFADWQQCLQTKMPNKEFSLYTAKLPGRTGSEETPEFFSLISDNCL